MFDLLTSSDMASTPGRIDQVHGRTLSEAIRRGPLAELKKRCLGQKEG